MVANTIPSVVTTFLLPSCSSASEELLTDATKQFRQLSIGRQLWTVMKNVFSPRWLAAPADSILATVVKQEWLLSDSTVNSAWIKLCSSMILSDIPSLSSLVDLLSSNQIDVGARRQLWTAVAHLWQAPREENWYDGVSFLVIPLMLVVLLSR
jgi:hypothetical protein